MAVTMVTVSHTHRTPAGAAVWILLWSLCLVGCGASDHTVGHIVKQRNSIYRNVENVTFIDTNNTLPYGILREFVVYATVPDGDTGPFDVYLGLWRRLGPRDQAAYILDYQQLERLPPENKTCHFPTRPVFVQEGSFFGFVFAQSTGAISNDWDFSGRMDLSAPLEKLPEPGDVIRMTQLNYFNIPSVSVLLETITIDIDECALNTHNCEHICVKTCVTCKGYQCECRPGYTLHNDGTSCHNIDECLDHNGGCDHNCTDNGGGYECTCRDGYNLTKNGRTCEDYNECKQGTTCSTGGCINTLGGYDCISLFSMDEIGGLQEPLHGADPNLTEKKSGKEKPGRTSHHVVWIAVNSIFVAILLVSIVHIWCLKRRRRNPIEDESDNDIEIKDDIIEVWTIGKNDRPS